MDVPPPPLAAGCSGWLAILAAAVPVSVVIAAVSGLLRLLPFVMGVTMVIAMVIGAPILSYLQRRGRVTWRSVAKGGFIAGAIVPLLLLPFAIPAMLSQAMSAHGGRIDTVTSLAVFIGGHSAAGIAGAFATWGLLAWLAAEQGLPVGRRWRSGLLVILVVGAIFGGAAVPGLFVDRSCHHPTRDGRTSIDSVAGFELRIPPSDWPMLSRALRQFADAGHWSFRDSAPSSPDMQWFDASLCTEAGTQIQMLNGSTRNDNIVFSVFQPQGGESWKQPVHALQRKLEALWPGAVSYPPGVQPHPPWPVEPAPAASSAKVEGNQSGDQRYCATTCSALSGRGPRPSNAMPCLS